MKVLLVSPTALDFSGKPIRLRRMYLPGLTLPMLAAVTPPGVFVRIVCETVEPVPFDEPWDLVGLTGMGSGIARAWQISDVFRKLGVRVVQGGIAASLAPTEWMLEHADSVVTGEAEEVWAEVVRDAEACRLQPVYRMKRHPPIEDLPLPRYDLLSRWPIGRWRPVQATRGCPFTCRFCSVTSFYGGTYRKRPIELVIRDVREAKRTGSRYIAFIDDNIAIDWSYCAELWEALIPEKITWMSQASIQIASNPAMLRLARRSGCRLLSFGIESTNPESLESIDKGWNNPERYGEAIKSVRRHGIDVSTEMIIGLDGDDPSIFQKTYDFIMEHEISVPRVHIMTPVPGTPLFDALSREGRILSHEWGRYSGGRVVFHPRRIDPEDLQSGYWRLYERLFSWRAILRRIGRNPASLGPFMRAVVAGTNLHYREHVRRRICPGIV